MANKEFHVAVGREITGEINRVLTFTDNRLRVTTTADAETELATTAPILNIYILAGRDHITGQIRVIETTATGAIKVSYP